MGFQGISIDKYIKKHLKNNSSENEKDLRERLISALADYKKGVKCSCGKDIWIIGSASVGNSCFTCITGESEPDSDYEIASVLKERENRQNHRQIGQFDKIQIPGFFDDNGFEINTELINKPSLCLTCIKDDNPNEEMLCYMTRHDQQDGDEFKCFAYRKSN